MAEVKRSKMKDMCKAFLLPVVVFLFFAVATKGRFSSASSILSIFRTAVVPALLAMSMSFGMTMGMWNFAAGAMVVACAIFSANISNATGAGIWGVCVFSIIIGVVLCTIMGLLYNWLRIPCMVLSLGYAIIVEALPNMLVADSTGRIGLFDGFLGGAPWCYVIVFIMFLLFYYINNLTSFGADMRAIGANIRIANNAGTNIDKVKLISFILSGLFLGVAGIEYISINVAVIGVTGFASSSMIFDGMMGIFVAMVLVKYIDYNVAVLIGVITIRMLGAGLVACGLSSEMRGILTGVFLFLVMAYSANAGLLDKIKSKKMIAEEADHEYCAMSH